MRSPDPLPQETPLVGWQAIGKYLGISASYAKALAKVQPFPLPHYRSGREPWASPLELQVWLRHRNISGITVQSSSNQQIDDGESETTEDDSGEIVRYRF